VIGALVATFADFGRSLYVFSRDRSTIAASIAAGALATCPSTP